MDVFPCGMCIYIARSVLVGYFCFSRFAQKILRLPCDMEVRRNEKRLHSAVPGMKSWHGAGSPM